MNRTAKNSLVYLSGTVIMGVLGFVNTMLLTRILPQQVYAMYGLLVTFVTAADMFVAFGYDQSYMRFYYSHDRTPLGFLWQCMKVPLIIFGVVAVVVLTPGQHLLGYIFGEKLGIYVAIGILGQIFFFSIGRFAQLTARMGEFASNYVLSNIVGRTGFLLLLALFALIVESISFSLVVLSNVLTAVASIWITTWVFRKLGNVKNPEGKYITNREMLCYGIPFMINNVMVSLVPVMEKVVIRNLAGWETLSIYTAASIFQTVVFMVVNTLNNIWNPIVYKHYENKAIFQPILHTFGMVSAIILSLGTAACILLRRWLVLLLDTKYHIVYVIAPIIILASCFHFLSIIYSVGVNIEKKTVHFVIATMLQIVSSLLACYLLIPPLGLTGAALSMLISVGISHFYRIIAGLRYYGTGRSEVKAFLLCIVSILAAVYALVYTELYSDILLSGLLVLAAFAIVNKDLLPIIRSVVGLIKPDKKMP